MSNIVTKQTRVLQALQNNERGLTEAQIRARFGVGNARSTVSALRTKGYTIIADRRTDSKGRTKTFYQLDTSAVS